MKKYKLLKDTVEVKAGTIFVYKERMDADMGEHTRFIPAGYYVEGFVFDGQISAPYYEKSVIENNPEWFEEVKEEVVELTERQEKIQSILDSFVDSFSVNKEKGTISINRNKMVQIIKEIEETDKPQSDEAKARRVIVAGLKSNHAADFDTSNQSDQIKFTVHTEDGFKCTDGDIIYGIAIQASGIDQWREQKLPFKTPIGESRVWFKDKEKANQYLIINKKCLSFSDIMDRVMLSKGSRNRLIQLAKSRI